MDTNFSERPFITEQTLLQQEVQADALKNGPMKTIVDLQTELLKTPASTQAFAHYDKQNKSLIGNQPFTYQNHHYTLSIALFPDEEDTAVRVSISDPLLPVDKPQASSLNPDLQLQPQEVTFCQYNLTNYKGTYHATSAIASAPVAPRGFAKSLMLSTHFVLREVMKKMNIQQLEASIGNASTDISGE